MGSHLAPEEMLFSLLALPLALIVPAPPTAIAHVIAAPTATVANVVDSYALFPTETLAADKVLTDEEIEARDAARRTFGIITFFAAVPSIFAQDALVWSKEREKKGIEAAVAKVRKE